MLLFCVFFFFKQKTAYEMRISDWSSDVCSSDLPMRFEEWEAASPQTIFVSATPGNYEAEHAGRVIEQVVRPTGLVDPRVEVRPALTQEIGRASCRERVGQDV